MGARIYATQKPTIRTRFIWIVTKMLAMKRRTAAGGQEAPLIVGRPLLGALVGIADIEERIFGTGSRALRIVEAFDIEGARYGMCFGGGDPWLEMEFGSCFLFIRFGGDVHFEGVGGVQAERFVCPHPYLSGITLTAATVASSALGKIVIAHQVLRHPLLTPTPIGQEQYHRVRVLHIPISGHDENHPRKRLRRGEENIIRTIRIATVIAAPH